MGAPPMKENLANLYFISNILFYVAHVRYKKAKFKEQLLRGNKKMYNEIFL